MESTPGCLPNRRVIELMHELVCSQFSYWHAKQDRLWHRWCAEQSGLDYPRSKFDIEDDDYDSVAWVARLPADHDDLFVVEEQLCGLWQARFEI